jgi:hypothetical protein
MLYSRSGYTFPFSKLFDVPIFHNKVFTLQAAGASRA